jgi:hypothetical protein
MLTKRGGAECQHSKRIVTDTLANYSREGQGLGLPVSEPLGLVKSSQLLGRLIDTVGVLNVL